MQLKTSGQKRAVVLSTLHKKRNTKALVKKINITSVNVYINKVFEIKWSEKLEG